jgi:glycosyltransferase involved in cell wall biosynthesis
MKIMNCPVSVVIPTYNSHNSIVRTVNSVVNQTVKPAELIIVDDGSNDDTLKILETLQKQYGKDWLKIIALESNSGPSVARNIGWEMASNEYIAFLDADDAWHPEKITVQYSWMIRNPEVILSAHPCILSITHQAFNSIQIPDDIEINLISKYQILSSNKFFTPCVMLKSNIHNRFCTSKRYCEDYLLWLEIILAGGKAAILNYPMTMLFKENFGESGLSSKLWKMELNELDNYKLICEKGYISNIEKYIFSSWSFIKYLRRVIITNLRFIQKNEVIEN